MKKWRWWLGIAGIIVFLAACSSRPLENGGNALQQGQQLQKDEFQEENEKIYSQKELQLVNLMQEAYEKLKTVKQTLTFTYLDGDQEYIQTKSTQETYDEGVLGSFLVDTTFEVGDQVATFRSFVEENQSHDKYLNDAWHASKTYHEQTLFIHWIKFLFEGPNVWDIHEKDNHIEIMRNIEEADNLALLPTILDLPFIMVQQPDTTATMQAIINKETGNIESAQLEAILTVDEREIVATVQAEIDSFTESLPFEVNLKELATTPEGDNDLEKFRNGNPVQAINYYENIISEVRKDKQDQTFQIIASEQGELQIALEAPVQDEKMGEFTLIEDGMKYSFKDGEISQEEVHVDNFYAFFVNRFIDRFDQIEKIDFEDQDGEENILTYREGFTNEEFDDFADATGKHNVSGLKREDEAVYVIEYIVDSTTRKLLHVNLWSLEENEEQISKADIISFTSQNHMNPNVLIKELDEKLLDKLK